jgi:hypothetical protein
MGGGRPARSGWNPTLQAAWGQTNPAFLHKEREDAGDTEKLIWRLCRMRTSGLREPD